MAMTGSKDTSEWDSRQQSLEHQFIHITPAPVFSRFKGLDDGVARGVKMLGGVLVLGAVAAADVAAFQAKAQMDPGIAHFEAFLATRAAGFDLANGTEMGACNGHSNITSRMD
jgi:hypothetical protein